MSGRVGGSEAQGPMELLDVESLIDAESLAIRDTVRRFVEERLRPKLGPWYEAGIIPARDIAEELGRLGVLGMHLDGYGCAGASATAYGLACLELEAADSGIRSLVSVQGSLAMFAIWKHGTDEQRERWLPSMAAGVTLGCFGLTESDFGSNPSQLRTRARRDGSDWVLTGNKMWITNGSIADIAVVWARADDEIRGFLVPTDTPGFSSREIHGKLSLRASVTSELVLEGVRLPESALLPGAKGLSGPLSCLNEARFGIVFGVLGAARDCLETAIRYSQTRSIFDRPLASYQISQVKLANMAVELGKGMLLALHLARLKDQGTVRPEQISVGKLNNTREAIQIARECRAMLGAAGITQDFPVLRHANNLESVLTYEGTSEIHQLIIGKALTGLQAFR